MKESAQYDRVQLAAETAAVLRTLDPDDEAGHRALARRLKSAGITRTMHADQLPRTDWEQLRMDGPRDEWVQFVKDNHASVLPAKVTTHTWPRDKRIEFELGQLLPALERGPRLGDSRRRRMKLLDEHRDQLLELRDLPGGGDPQPRPGAHAASIAPASDAPRGLVHADKDSAPTVSPETLASVQKMLAEHRRHSQQALASFAPTSDAPFRDPIQLTDADMYSAPMVSPETLADVQKMLAEHRRRQQASAPFHASSSTPRAAHPDQYQQRGAGPDAGPSPGMHR